MDGEGARGRANERGGGAACAMHKGRVGWRGGDVV